MARALVVYPFAYNVWLSLQNQTATRPGRFVGLDTYARLLADPDIPDIIGRTLVWTVGAVAGQIVLGMALALVVNAAFRGRWLARSVLLVPFALSTVVVVFIWSWLLNDLNGVVNYLLMSGGAIGDPIVFLGSRPMAKATVVMVAIWQGTPLVVLFLLAGLQSIPRELYESARVDGGNAWQEFRHVTLPLLRPILATLVLFKVIWTFNWFDLIFLFTRGGPSDATQTLAIATYQEAFTSFRYSSAAAMGVMMFLLVVLVALPLMWWAERDV
jgi:ABC-type sugar transport system permease subunit